MFVTSRKPDRQRLVERNEFLEFLDTPSAHAASQFVTGLYVLGPAEEDCLVCLDIERVSDLADNINETNLLFLVKTDSKLPDTIYHFGWNMPCEKGMKAAAPTPRLAVMVRPHPNLDR